ncbi:MAG: HAMP domain-containing protein [Myxococcales bacterium]|nr:MAG: HAMP domain-containing protein [Myxococcales bacterium]
MRPRRLLWHIFPPIILIVVLSLLAISSYTSRSFQEFYVSSTADDLGATAELLKDILRARGSLADRAAIDTTVKRLGRLAGMRITVILPDGTVIADSNRNPAFMTLHDTRPEIVAALRTGYGSSKRYSETVKKDFLYVASPIRDDSGETTAVVRTAVPLTALESTLGRLRIQTAAAVLAIAAIAALITLMVSRRLTRPIEDLQNAAGRFASGDLSVRLAATGASELAGLAHSMNRMAAQLDDRIRAVREQRNEREAVLAGMVEAVLAVDRNEQVTTINTAACALFGVSEQESLGRSVQEIARDSELQSFVATALRSGRALESDLELHGDERRNLQAHGAPLRDARGQQIGAVIVLNDVTRLRRLESIRRDFVANVSHELKTPITCIKGFIETLSEGAIDDPTAARRFLAIVGRQADRLSAIIEDLLDLSRIEQEGELGTVPVTLDRIGDILAGALEVCRLKADAKSIALELECDPAIEVRVSAPLLEQAVVNLVDNAVKYSDPGASVSVRATCDAADLRIDVIDDGCGIESRHLPRLFERFYRVDKARSRSLGGTGLGLAIVKHIAQAHRGDVSVQSRAGEGTRFTIRIPVHRQEDGGDATRPTHEATDV